MTPSTLETLVRNKFNAINDTFFTTNEIPSYIYEAELELVTEFDLIESSATDTTVLDQRNYDYPSDAYKIKAILVDGESVKKMSLKDGQDYEIWDDATSGTPDRFYTWNNIIYLNPRPDTAGETITIYYYALPTDPSISNTIDIPAELHQKLSSKILANMYAKDQNATMANFYATQWETVDKPKIQSYMRRQKRGDRFTEVRIVNE